MSKAEATSLLTEIPRWKIKVLGATLEVTPWGIEIEESCAMPWGQHRGIVHLSPRSKLGKRRVSQGESSLKARGFIFWGLPAQPRKVQTYVGAPINETLDS